jgi:hypothetical protein
MAGVCAPLPPSPLFHLWQVAQLAFLRYLGNAESDDSWALELLADAPQLLSEHVARSAKTLTIEFASVAEVSPRSGSSPGGARVVLISR